MQTSRRILNGNHTKTKDCRMRGERRVQREEAINSALYLREVFTAYGEELKRVEVFKYLGRLLDFDDTDAHVVRENLRRTMK